MIPRLISGWPKLADSAAIRKSQAIASSQPPPSASELTAATVTLLDCSMRRSTPWPPSSSSLPAAGSVIFVNSLMSAPAQKTAKFEEANRTARISSRDSISSQSAVRSRIICGEIGLVGGRLSHRIASSSRVSSSTVSVWSAPSSGRG